MFRIFLPIVIMLASVVGGGEIIHACVANSNGAVRIVIEGEACAADEHAVEWGLMGLQGPAGAAGPAGPGGPAGAQGPAGVGDLGCANGQTALWNAGAAAWQCSTPPDVAALEARIAQLETLLAGVTRSNNTVQFSGVNLQVVDGSGGTDGTTNGLGNLIIGYNEERNIGNFRSGSHMLVVGMHNNFTSYGGVIIGDRNLVNAPFASITGGGYNSATAEGATVSGGLSNEASGVYATISGGNANTASGASSSVSGGTENEASGNYSSVSGGSENRASGTSASVTSGGGNWASGTQASVTGGGANTSTGLRSVVSGGYNRDAIGSDDWVAGTLIENE